MPRACALSEGLNAALAATPEAQSYMRTRGSDGSLMRLIQVCTVWKEWTVWTVWGGGAGEWREAGGGSQRKRALR